LHRFARDDREGRQPRRTRPDGGLNRLQLLQDRQQIFSEQLRIFRERKVSDPCIAWNVTPGIFAAVACDISTVQE
jgi:hypothetical protein